MNPMLQFWDMVADLRAQAEALILSANGTDDLLTCTLRPCNVFGPGDPQLIPLLLNMAKSNWDKVRKLNCHLTKTLQKITMHLLKCGLVLFIKLDAMFFSC